MSRRISASRQLGLEPLEDRRLLAVFMVTNTLDGGAGSLRQAILDANARLGADQIDFDFSHPTPTAPVAIAQAGVIGIDFGGLNLAGTLDVDTDGENTEDDNQIAPAGQVAVIRPNTNLPTITDTLEIDALLNEGFGLLTTPTPSVEILGDLIQGGSAGLIIGANNSNIRGLIINSVTAGVVLTSSASGNVIEQNLFGFHIDGTRASVDDGVRILGASNNEVRDNVFAVAFSAIYAKDGATQNIIQGNRISGGQNGIWLLGSSLNTIGGTTAGAGNVIAGTSVAGILVRKSDAFPSNGNTIQANRLAQNEIGVSLDDAFATVIGGDSNHAANYFRTNVTGLEIESGGNNHVIKNRFGTNDAGTATRDAAGADLGNKFEGIRLTNSVGNEIRANQIAGLNPSRRRAIELPAAIKVSGALGSDNRISANLIGTNNTGDAPLANFGSGIIVTDGAQNTKIDGNTIAASTVVSPDLVADFGDGISLAIGIAGIVIEGAETTNTTVQGNHIGTDSAGTKAIGNQGAGIIVSGLETVIGGSGAGEENTLSGNAGFGIAVVDSGRATILANFVGTNSAGTRSVPNTLMGILLGSSGNVVGGLNDGDRNVVSGNGFGGIAIVKSENNLVLGNRIGVDKTGTAAIGNKKFGVILTNADANQIGGVEPGSQNIIGGNKEGGILVIDSHQNTILGNRIGVGAVGIPVGNGGPGIKIDGGSQNRVGGLSTAAQNWIGDNKNAGIDLEVTTANKVQGNRIGGVGHGNKSSGIFGEGGFDNEIVGNEISNQFLNGIHLLSGEGNLIFVNTIEDNRAAGILLDGADDNVVGDNSTGGNILHSNLYGVRLIHGAQGNQLQNNDINENRNAGIYVDDAQDNVVGGAVVAHGNKILSNGVAGIYVRRGTGNRFESNAIHDNRGLGIDLRHGRGPGVTPNDDLDADTGANGLQNFPIIDAVSVVNLATTVVGVFRSTPNTEFRLQFFANDLPDTSGYGEGKTLLGSIDGTTDANGELAFQPSFENAVVIPGQTVTAIAIAPNGDTSEFSPFFRMPTAEEQANQVSAGSQGYAKNASDARGNFVVAWLGPRSDAQFKTTVWYRRFRADGTPLDDSDQAAPSDPNTSGPTGFDVAMDDAGNFVIVWDDSLVEDPEVGIYGRRFGADGNPLDAQQFHVNTITAQEQRYPAVAMDADGDFVVTFQSGSYFGPLTGGNQYYIYARRFSSSGQALDAQEFRLNDFAAVDQEYPAIAMDDTGNFVIAWNNQPAHSFIDTSARRYSAAGQPLGEEIRVSSDNASVRYNGAQVAMGSGDDFALVWEAGTEIRLRRYSAAGELLDNTPIVVASAVGNLYPHAPSIAKDGDGNIIVTWYEQISFTPSDQDVFARRFSAAGDPLDAPTRVHDFTSGIQRLPDIAADPLGGYVIAWDSENQDGDGTGAFYRSFGDRPDIGLNSAVTNGTTGLTISYAITGKVNAFDLDVYRSTDGLVNSGDTLLGTVHITEATDLIPGPHIKSFTIGNSAGEIPLPGAGAAEVDGDYRILIAADSLNHVRESDADPLIEDNVQPLTGVYHSAGSSVFVLGTAGSDSVLITRGSIIVDVDGDVFTFSEADVTDVRVRAQEGDDEVTVDGHSIPLMAHGGDGQDKLTGGAGADHLSGGAGNDEILGGDGNDLLDGGTDDDIMQGQGGDDQMLGQDGNDSLEGGADQDTLDGGAGENQVITFGADTVVSAADTVINDAIPSIHIPAATFPVRVGSSIHFGGTDENRINIVDPFPEGTLQLKLNVSPGTLTLASLAGLTLVSGTGTNDAEITMRGTLDDLNAALDGLHVNAPATAGSIPLQITLNETAGAGQQLDTETLSFTVLPAGQPILDELTVRTAENRPAGSVVATLAAIDPDTDQTLTYSILSGNTSNVFALDEASGKLSIANPSLFDFETTSSFTLTVSVTDNGVPALSDTATITVEVLDANDPPDARDDVFSLGGSSDPIPLDVLANDLTTPEIGETLTIIAVTQPADGTVAISQDNTVTYTPGTTGSATDTFTYTISDGRGGFDIASVSFTSNPPPTDITLSNSAIKENLSGAIIGTLSVTDPDSGQTHTLAVSDTRFEIVGTTLKLKNDQFVQLSQGATVSVDVTATDSGSPPQSLTKTFVLQVSANAAAWKNPSDPLDTNADGKVVPLDALRIINQLNAPTVLESGNKLPKARPADSSLTYYDVNGDGFCTSNDVLRVVNFLNSSSSEGEGVPGIGEESAQHPLVVVFHSPTIELGEVDALQSSASRRTSAVPSSPVTGSEFQPVLPRDTSNSSRAFRQVDRHGELESLLDNIATDVLAAWLRSRF